MKDVKPLIEAPRVLCRMAGTSCTIAGRSRSWARLLSCQDRVAQLQQTCRAHERRLKNDSVHFTAILHSTKVLGIRAWRTGEHGTPIHAIAATCRSSWAGATAFPVFSNASGRWLQQLLARQAHFIGLGKIRNGGDLLALNGKEMYGLPGPLAKAKLLDVIMHIDDVTDRENGCGQKTS